MENTSPQTPVEPEERLPSSVMDDPNVCSVRLGDREIILVGTAHVSRSSADLVERAIRELKPDAVAVELCSGRYEALRDPERWKNTNIVSVVRAGKAHLLLAQLLLASFQRKIAKQLGVRPGEEMLRAVAVADELEMQTVLADRDVTTTLRRTWAALGWKSLMKIGVSGVFSIFESEQISEEEIERLKTSDALEEALKELSGALPEVRSTLIDERDRYLAEKITRSSGQKVVAVLGAGHISGVKNYLGQPQDLEMLERVPPPNKRKKWIELVVFLSLVAAFIWGFTHGGAAVAGHLVGSWALVCAVAAAVGSALALAHPLTILASFVCAPVAIVHPLLAAGWIAGTVEATLRQPRVADFESLLDDINSVGGLWGNRVSRVLLIVVTTNVGAAIGNLAGLALMARNAWQI